MVFSMTGFATKTIEIPASGENKAYLTITLKSLNSRFFEAACKLPHALQPLEIEFMKLMKDSLYRGKISFAITMSNPILFKGPIEPSFYMVKSYLDALQQIQKKYDIPGAVSIAEILTLPHIFVEEEVLLNDAMQNLILDATKQIIVELRKEQHNEGIALKKDIEERISLLQHNITKIAALADQVTEKHKLEIHLKLAQLTTNSSELLDLTKHQLSTELERMDINEEIVRFKSHIVNLSETIASDQKEKGRRIDFIVQELMREINTIGAKCSDTSISTHVITVKVELEKIREQAQNIV